MSQPVAFLCLGTMGYPMAAQLARAGHRVAVYNRTGPRADAWLAEHGAAGSGGHRVAATPADAARGAAVVFTCAGNDDDLREVVLSGSGALAGMEAGALLVDHTTVSPGLAREIARAAGAKQIESLDAPVSGGQAGAEKGALTIMVGGSQAAYDRAVPLLGCYAKRHVLMGSAGTGQLTKAVNQICIAGLVQALSEGLAFAERAGLDTARVVEVISGGAAQSWQMDNRAATMLARKFDFGFAVDWMRKDLDIAITEAARIGASLPVTELVDTFYAELQRLSRGRDDTSSLIDLLLPPVRGGR